MTEQDMLRRMSVIVQRNATAADLKAAQDRYTGQSIQPVGAQEYYRCTRVRLDTTRRIVLDLALERDLAPLVVQASGIKPRGLAALSPERRREIARAGGKTSTGGFRAMDVDRLRGVASTGGQHAHQNGHTHEWDREEAIQAAHRRWELASVREAS